MADRRGTDNPKGRFRTGIANGSKILDGIDGRSHVARRFREVGAAIRDDLNSADLTEAQQQLVRSAAGLVVLRESMDVQVVNGEEIDVSTYCTIANTLRRVLTTIGLARVPKDVTPTLAQYLQAERIE